MHRNFYTLSYIILSSLFLLACTTRQEAPVEAIVEEKTDYEVFRIQQGTNISHWLSQSSRRGAEREAFFDEEDVTYLAGLGFDHLRIPVDEEQMFDEAGNKNEEAFTLLHNALGWCRKYGLRAIVDLHILRSHHFNEEEKPLWTDPAAQEKFIQLWQVFSDELSRYPNGMLAYELMNEPVADEADDWNQLVAKAVAAIREKEAERTLVIGSNRWQSADTFDELVIPGNDENILLSFHFYEPFLLTHYRASWTNIAAYDGPVHYPGWLVKPEEYDTLSENLRQIAKGRIKYYNRDTLEKMMRKPIAMAKQTGLPLYCGEWGVIENAPREARLRWYGDMTEIFERNDIAYANWDYKSDNFGLIGYDGLVNDELVEIIATAGE
jgi:endoglucanase